jgi:DNA mismatch repair ATPase MutS
LARIKLKIGENELEVDSRDFYVDNQTLGEIVDNISQYLPENQVKIVYGSEPTSKSNSAEHGLEYLDDAETFEPEFNEPKYITSTEIKSKLKILETSKFFDSPRTVSETVQQLREYGWATGTLDVSKALAKMSLNKKFTKSLSENKTCYLSEHLPLSS